MTTFKELLEATEFAKKALKSARTNIKRLPNAKGSKAKIKTLNKYNDIHLLTITGSWSAAGTNDFKKWLEQDGIKINQSIINSSEIVFDIEPK